MAGPCLILLTGAAALLPPAAPEVVQPTIELHTRVHADSLRIETQGNACLTVEANPLLVKETLITRSKPVPSGQSVRDVDIQVDLSVTVDPKAEPVAANPDILSGEPPP